MLTKNDLRYNFRLLRRLSTTAIFPLDVNLANGTVQVPKSQWKRRVARALLITTALHGAYVNLKLVMLLLSGSQLVRHHLVFHVDLALASFMICGWYLACFMLYPYTFVALFNDIFGDPPDEPEDGECKHSEPEPEPRSRQEVLAIAMPFIIVFAVAIILAIFAYDGTMAFLLYTSLPESWQTPFSFRILFIEEVIFLAFIGSNGGLVLNVQLLFFEKVIGDLKHLKRSTSSSNFAQEKTHYAYKELRKIQLSVSLFNTVNNFISFSFKLFCITMCTLNGYFMIVHFSADPVFGTIYYLVFGILCSFYSIMYERAFAIPKMVRQTKKLVMLRAGTEAGSRGLKRHMEQRLRSVPAMGIKVGHFHTFERVATPVFIDYVLRNVVGLLVMHRR